MNELFADLAQRRANLETGKRLGSALRGTRYLAGTGGRLALRQRTLRPVTADGGWSQLRRNGRRFETFEVVYQTEQAPDPDNRIVLGSGLDEFGLRRAKVRSRWSELDLYTIHRASDALAGKLERIGRFTPSAVAGEPPVLYQVGGAHHHLGTTRMHADATMGVVDANCRVHGVQNLYVAGSSVFPTGGYANPTLTIVALALRLSDHLAARLP